MTGNEFVKYPPHKNLGLPHAEYNLMRMQMEAAKLPFMIRTFPGRGTLAVSKIYGNQYAARWAPVQIDRLALPVHYVAIYKKGVMKVKFLDIELGDLGEYDLSDFPTESDINDGILAVSHYSCEWEVNGLIALLRNVKVDPGDDHPQHYIEFYDPGTGSIIYSLAVGSDGDDFQLQGSNIFIDAQDPNTLFVMVGPNTNTLITVSKDEDGVYDFSTRSIDYSVGVHPIDGDEGPTSGILYENGKFFYEITEHSGSKSWHTVIVTDRDCTVVLEILQGGNEVVDGRSITTYHRTPSAYRLLDVTIGGDPDDRVPIRWITIAGDFDDFFNEAEDIPDNPLYNTQYISYGPFAVDSLNGTPFFTWYDIDAGDRKGFRLTDGLMVEGVIRFYPMASQLDILKNPKNLCIEWVGLSGPTFTWYVTSRFTGDETIDTTPYISINGVSLTEDEFYKRLSISEGVTTFIALLCLPGLGRNEEIAGVVNSRTGI